MIKKFNELREKYPSQFWLLFWGMLISMIGSSMIWPFMLIFISKRLNLPLSAIASLMTISAVSSLIASFASGQIADRFGRKNLLITSQILNSLTYLGMIWANQYWIFAILMAIRGIGHPMYQVGADTMVSDLIPEGKRIDAFALIRMGKNVGIAIGPAIGGFLAIHSYTIVLLIAIISMTLFAIILAIFAIETKPAIEFYTSSNPLEGYGDVFKNFPFISIVVAFLFVQIGSSIMWTLLSVYMNIEFNIPENMYGFLPTTNAIIVVTLQLAATKIAKNYRPLYVIAFGAILYTIAFSGVGLSSNFWAFLLCMVIMSIGELFLVPTVTTYAANSAPQDKRGRYMSVFSLTWGVASGIGPMVGSYLNDYINPQATWFGASIIAFFGAITFLFISQIQKKRIQPPRLSRSKI